jgi:SAM-dependent methyltransferase
MNQQPGTKGQDYAQRLRTLESVWWKRFLDVQRPYRRHLQSLDLGFVLDIGCGLGRNLCHLKGNGVGVDHNPVSIYEARSRGLTAFLPPEFLTSDYAANGRFDTILCAHVVEHMHRDEAQRLLAPYLPFLREKGRLVLITPQEAGFRSDPTHVEFCDLLALADLSKDLGLKTDRAYSFPFPRAIGRIFKYNEFVFIARK